MDKLVIDRLEAVLARYNQIQEDLQNDEVIANLKRYTELSKESRQLEETTKTYLEYKGALQTIEEAKILILEDDPEMVEMAKEEMKEAEGKLDTLEEKLNFLLLPKDPNDERNVIMEIRGAAGGDEANIFAADLFRMYSRYAETKGWKIEVMDSQETGLGGFSQIGFMVSGDAVYSFLKYESGAHRVQRIPVTESNGRIQTSTATVLVMPEVEDVSIEINPSDLRIDVYCASGHGGQGVNTTPSAVRITHLPTNTVVTCQNERSQIQNKEKAMEVLKSKLYQLELDKRNNEIQELKGNQVDINFGSQIRSYIMCPYSLVKDHRTNCETSNVSKVLDGEIDLFINEFLKGGFNHD